MSGVDFARLRGFGAAIALIDETGAEISYGELADLCAAFLPKIGAGRQLVLLHAANDLGSVVCYLSALEAGHPLILTVPRPGGPATRIVRDFAPTVVCQGGQLERVSGAAPVDAHPDLSLLLPTSGSSGSPKLVRLSRRNLDANAEAIAQFLEIEPGDRAITNLPLHYSYGLSVLNSHLRVGASVVLTDLSVVDPAFWALFREKRATSLAGVPHSYELFERIGLRDNPPVSLRVMTQAGGRMAPELVRTYAAFAAARGGRFYAMYGQTEASPRMAYLPPGLAGANADCIGIAIPGGDLRLLDGDGREISDAGVAGELAYRGPNVMLGYAHRREDLAKGPELEELRTGDLAERTEQGLYRIAGRISRFVKIAGLRIELDDMEHLLAEAGYATRVGGGDGLVSICVLGDEDAERVRQFAATRCALPIANVSAFAVAEAPLLSSGKIDYAAIHAEGERRAEQAAAASGAARPIAAAYANALGIELPSGDVTFAELGGDSLSYVNAVMGIERALGDAAPEGWETLPLSTLEAMVPDRAVPRAPITSITTETVVRVGALAMVISRHANEAQAGFLAGGANILFALAGFSLARFQGNALLKGSVGPAMKSAVYRVILPYFAFVAAILALRPAGRSIAWFLMVSEYFVRDLGPLRFLWFIESLFHALLITCVLFSIPAWRRFAARRPFAASLTMVAGAAALWFRLPLDWQARPRWDATVEAWLYAYFIGWAAYMARTGRQKALVLALAGVLTTAQFGLYSSRAPWLVAGLSVVMFAPRLRLPTRMGVAVSTLAAASYFIYLVHSLPVHFALKWADEPLASARIPMVLAVSAILGFGYYWAWKSIVPNLRRVVLQIFDTARGKLKTPTLERTWP
jgi:hypothetical protein